MSSEVLEEATKKIKKKKSNTPKIQDIRDNFLSSPLASQLLYHEQEKRFYKYNEAKYSYEPLSQDEFATLLDRFLISRFSDTTLSVTNKVIKEVMDALIRDQSIKKASHYPNIQYISAFADGTIFDFATHLKLPSDTPCFHYFDFPFPSSPIPTPAFDKFLRETFTTEKGEESQELQDFMLSVFAYYLSPLFPNDPVAFVFQGGGSNGKSVFLKLLQAFIGEQNISSLSMEDLSDRFSSSALVGKRLNLVSEDQSRFIKVDKIKAMISLEKVKVERKYQDTFFFEPKAKHIFSTNKEVKFDDVDYAILRRIKVIPFFRTFVGDIQEPGDPKIDNIFVLPRTKNLMATLLDERPGIFFKVLTRMEELHRNNFQITYPNALLETQKQVQEFSSSALEFFHEYYEIDETEQTPIPTSEMYAQYENWYSSQDRPPKYKLQSKQFFSVLQKNFPSTYSTETRWSQHLKKMSKTKIHIVPKKHPIAGLKPKEEPDALVSPL